MTFSRLNEVDMTKEHGHANFMIGCKNCSKKGFILIDPKSSYRAEPDEDGVIKSVIATMECRCV